MKIAPYPCIPPGQSLSKKVKKKAKDVKTLEFQSDRFVYGGQRRG
jgi:hypothetical protein